MFEEHWQAICILLLALASVSNCILLKIRYLKCFKQHSEVLFKEFMESDRQCEGRHLFLRNMVSVLVYILLGLLGNCCNCHLFISILIKIQKSPFPLLFFFQKYACSWQPLQSHHATACTFSKSCHPSSSPALKRGRRSCYEAATNQHHLF